MRLNGEAIVKKKMTLKNDRGVWETHWQELAQYIVPRKDSFTKSVIPGEKKGITLFDNTSMVSCEMLVSSLHGMLTNPNTLWMELATGFPELDEQDHIAEYLQGLTKRTHVVLNNSNFQPEVYEYYLDICSIGTGCMTAEEDDKSIVRFSSKHISNIFVCENNLGFIDDVIREFKWTATQLVQEFVPNAKTKDEVEKVLSKEVADAWDKGKSDKFVVNHAVYPENSNKAMPYISQYVLEHNKKEVKEGRFKEFPYLIGRWSKSSEEVYGRSPGMVALPEAKTLNLMAKTMIKGAQKTVDPPVQMPDDGFVRPLKTFPAGVNYYRAGSNDRVEPIFNDMRIDFGFEAIRERQQRVREAFFIDKLQMADKDRMTRLEVGQRIQEQLRFLGPLIGRQQVEFLRPLINRVLRIMIEKDEDGSLIGEVPPELAGVDLDVQYTSPIARAQRASESDAMNAALAASLPIIQIDPNARDVIDTDGFVKEQFVAHGATRKALRSNEEVSAIRDAREQAQAEALQQQQSLVQSQQVSDISKAVR